MLEQLTMYLRARRSLGRRGKGFIHVGANLGQERDRYAKHRRPVVWIECDPSLIGRLRDHVSCYPEQRVIEALVSDKAGEEVDFYIANNDGGASSMLEMGEALTEMYPDIHYEKSIRLTTTTLPEALGSHGIDLAMYDVLAMDTQGSELRILRGARDILGGFRYVQVEVADFEAYKGCARKDETIEFMESCGFGVFISECFTDRTGVGKYYDITFARKSSVRKSSRSGSRRLSGSV